MFGGGEAASRFHGTRAMDTDDAIDNCGAAVGSAECAKHQQLGPVHGDDNIEKNIIAHIPKKSTPIIIIGHSLGTWNGAHLSVLLSQKGYTVEMLVTLDPVGEANIVSSSSKFYSSTPKPTAKYWKNILADPQRRQFFRFHRRFGEQWKITSGFPINGVVDVNADAGIMFRTPIIRSPCA